MLSNCICNLSDRKFQSCILCGEYTWYALIISYIYASSITTGRVYFNLCKVIASYCYCSLVDYKLTPMLQIVIIDFS